MPKKGFAATVLAVGFWIAGVVGPGLSLAADRVVFRRHVDRTATDQVIVKWRDNGVAAVQIPTIEQRAERLRSITGAEVSPVHNLYGLIDVLRLPQALGHAQMSALLAQLRVDPGIEYAEPDGWRYIQATLDTAPNDPHFIAGSDANGSWQGQWYLKPSSSTTPSAISATTAWQSTTGAASVVVAVIDTGVITGHPDLVKKLLPGYDFVSCDQGNNTDSSTGIATSTCSASGAAATYYFANDNNQGWHADASDPGDWITDAEVAMTLFQDAGCTESASSSWHGTKVAGIIGAQTNNGVGIAGIAPATMLLPIRVLGVCTGRVSDIAAAITWAYGGAVSGVTSNAHPAKIINLSLGAPEPCSQTEQTVISAAIAANVLVVAAAGNDGGPVNAPANCNGVLSVAGVREAGTKVGYSSLSSQQAASTDPAATSVTIAAPAGNCVKLSTKVTQPTTLCEFSVETTTDEGSTNPAAIPGFYTYAKFNQTYANGAGANSDNAGNVGTSFAAPMVSGAAALMLAEAPTLTPSQLIARMRSSALAFPTSSSTTSTACQLVPTTVDSKSGKFTNTSQNTECVCTTATCGAGMLNAAAAVSAASGIFVQITPSSTTGTAGQRIQLDGSGSTAAAGYSIVSYQWSTIPSTSDQLINPNEAIATLIVPSFRTIQVKLTITDSGGHTASATATIQSKFGASAGAGAFGPELWVLAAISAGALARRRRFANAIQLERGSR